MSRVRIDQLKVRARQPLRVDLDSARVAFPAHCFVPCQPRALHLFQYTGNHLHALTKLGLFDNARTHAVVYDGFGRNLSFPALRLKNLRVFDIDCLISVSAIEPCLTALAEVLVEPLERIRINTNVGIRTDASPLRLPKTLAGQHTSLETYNMVVECESAISTWTTAYIDKRSKVNARQVEIKQSYIQHILGPDETYPQHCGPIVDIYERDGRSDSAEAYAKHILHRYPPTVVRLTSDLIDDMLPEAPPQGLFAAIPCLEVLYRKEDVDEYGRRAHTIWFRGGSSPTDWMVLRQVIKHQHLFPDGESAARRAAFSLAVAIGGNARRQLPGSVLRIILFRVFQRHLLQGPVEFAACRHERRQRQ